jgi:hypothetical protein
MHRIADTRLLADVVSLDAWHDHVTRARQSVVFVELAFREGRLGGDRNDFPLTFALSLKRAELAIYVDAPLEIVRKSIARHIPDVDIKRTATASISRSSKARSSGAIDLKTTSLSATAGLAAEISADSGQSSKLEVSEQPRAILVAGDPVAANGYRWSLAPSYLAHLVGQPWHPVDEPRLSVRAPAGHAEQSGVRVELTCRMEDMVVSNLEPKEPSLAERVRHLLDNDRRRKIAEHHIKHIIRSANIGADQIDNRFSRLILRSIAAASEQA